MNVETLSSAHFAARRSVVDALANELVEAFDGEATPGDACRKNEGPCPQNLVAVEKHLTRRRVDALDRAGNKNFRAKSLGLLQRAACKLIARDATGKSEIVLDPRRCSGLTTGCFAFDNHDAQTLRRSVDRRRKTRRPAADHHRVVFGKARAGLQTKQSRNI